LVVCCGAAPDAHASFSCQPLRGAVTFVDLRYRIQPERDGRASAYPIGPVAGPPLLTHPRRSRSSRGPFAALAASRAGHFCLRNSRSRLDLCAVVLLDTSCRAEPPAAPRPPPEARSGMGSRPRALRQHAVPEPGDPCRGVIAHGRLRLSFRVVPGTQPAGLFQQRMASDSKCPISTSKH
jgi:hypothetical protein